MSVWHTRAHFLEGGKRIVDNPAVGKALTEAYWEPGNSEMFLDLVQNLTGKPLSCDAWVTDLEEEIEDKVAAEKKDYAWAVAPREELAAVDLDMRMWVLDGDGDEWDWDDDNQQPATTRYSMPHSPHSNGIRILSLLSPLVLARGVGCADIRDPVCIQGHFGS